MILTGNPFTMENKRKIPKRIFSFFLAILCTFGILFVSYIDSFADFDVYVDIPDGLYSFYLKQGSHSQNTVSDFTFTVTLNSRFEVYSKSASNRWYKVCLVNGINISSSSSSNVIEIPYSETLVFEFGSASSGEKYFYFIFSTWAPTPSPTPEVTPAPATPTPNPYDPGGVPTPTGDYGVFFERMASDAQNAFNAIYLSWNGANSRFYSGIFFIGLPLLIGLFGLVASIILGDDD